MTFSQAVLHIRETLRLSQADFAKELGVSFSTINRWENEAQKPSQLALKMLMVYCEQHALPFNYIDDAEGETQQ